MFGADQHARVLHLIRQLRIRGLGVVLLSPTLDDVGSVADRIAVLRHGRVSGVFGAFAGAEQIRAAMSISGYVSSAGFS